MSISLNGYTTITFNATAQAKFVLGVAVQGGFETSAVEVIAVTDIIDIITSLRTLLLQTVSRL
jgi:hypothetical protein